MKPEHRQFILENHQTMSPASMAEELGIKERKIRKFIDQYLKKHPHYNDKQDNQDNDTENITAGKKAAKLKKKSIIITFIILIVLGAIVFSNSINGEFILDDDFLVKNNEYIKNWTNIPRLFTEDQGRGYVDSSYYRPLQSLTYMIEYYFWGYNVQPYHITNIILHLLVVMAVYWMISLLFRNNTLSLFTALLFLLHPIQSETVSYISSRGDCLVGLFTVLTFIIYLKCTKKPSILMYITLIISYALALFSKENSIILPGLFLLYHYCFKKRVQIMSFLGLMVIPASFIVFRMSMMTRDASSMTLKSIITRVPGFFAAIAGYARILIYPLHLHMGSYMRLFEFNDPRVLIGAAITLAALTCAFALKKKKIVISFSILWFFITLMPVSNLYPIAFYMTDHYLYLPSIGFFLIIASVIEKLYQKNNLRIYSMAILVALTGFYGFRTFDQNIYWSNPVIFSSETLKYSPNSSRAMNNLAIHYLNKKQYAESLNLFEKAIKINPKKAIYYSNYARPLYETGRIEESKIALEKSLLLDPTDYKAVDSLGILYLKINNIEKSLELHNKAIDMNPDYDKAYFNRANTLVAAKRYQEAYQSFKKALELNPYLEDAYNNLANLCYKFNKKEEAAQYLKKLIEINYNYYVAHSNLGLIYNDLGKKTEAEQCFKNAIKINPNYAEGYNNWGTMLSNNGNNEKALELYKKAIRINSSYAKPYANLATLYHKTGKPKIAMEYCKKAQSLGFPVNPKLINDIKRKLAASQ